VNPEMDCKIQKSMFGEYFLIIPYKCYPKIIKRKEYVNPVSIDPGVRKYLTTYAPNDQESYILGNRWSTLITEKSIKLDKLYSKISKKKGKEKNKIKDQILRIRKKICNLKMELKFQSANFISKKYDLIMIPKLESGKLCIKADRKLKTKTARSLLNAGHCKFFDILKDKCWENGSKFLHVREEYTSQTCPKCGELNKCNEVYKCKNCHFKHDRDIVGALNILLKGVR
jgi:putative transposase